MSAGWTSAAAPHGDGAPARTSLPRLHLVTDDAILAHPSFERRAREAMEAGGDRVAVHLRGPTTSGRVLFELGSRLSESAAASGAWWIVNDRADVALALGLLRVHLGERSLAVADARRILGGGAVIGRSIHSGREAVEVRGADYLLVGPVYATATHPGREALGLSGFGAIVRAVKGAPAIGIGGVGEHRVAEVLAAGGYGVAVVRGWWNAPDVRAAVLALLAAIARAGALSDEARPHAGPPAPRGADG